MPYTPHTSHDIQAMLDTIGVASVAELFDEIPQSLKGHTFAALPEGLSEQDMLRLMQERSEQNTHLRNFIGAGAYEHHIPAAIWDIVGRGEFYSAYTPYQAEASQGTLQLLYEYQSMIVALTGMDVANASLYDGATALAEAVLMAVRLNKKAKSKRILVAGTLHPAYRATVATLVESQGIVLEDLPFDEQKGLIDIENLPAMAAHDVAAVVVAQPNFLGQLEAVDALIDWAHQHDALAIGVVNPISLALLKPPGQWGQSGVDIACGEGQPMGVPLAAGGPYVGFMACKQAHVRQMPGRIIGRTTDLDGHPGFSLTLQAREQHIRRAKATSNICTNQSLLVTANTLYMALMGAEGLKRVASHSAANMRKLAQKLAQVEGVRVKYDPDNGFHELVLSLPLPAKKVIQRMAQQGILAGYDLGDAYPDWDNNMLVCVTETKNDADLEHYVATLAVAVTQKEGALC